MSEYLLFTCVVWAIVLCLVQDVVSAAADNQHSPLMLMPVGETATRDWYFVGGPWIADEQGVLTPADASADEHLGFYTRHAYLDFEAEFKFRWDNTICGAGLIFRAQDAHRYYLVHFHCTGQQYRTAHFWAAISKVDDSGHVKVLKMQTVPGVPSELGLWHRARLVVEGSKIQLWVDGRHLPPIEDQTYDRPGCVGLESYSGPGPPRARSFRNVFIRGKQRRASHGNPNRLPSPTGFIPLPR